MRDCGDVEHGGVEKPGTTMDDCVSISECLCYTIKNVEVGSQ